MIKDFNLAVGPVCHWYVCQIVNDNCNNNEDKVNNKKYREIKSIILSLQHMENILISKTKKMFKQQ